ncbi:AAA family ATPase [Desulfolutivibrio sulfoxidireducens]|uniref:AAA family ATPase n=1 Tax=Desulfolutivibrio sulfoxidireducens TaxID=2773299 RepID=UPI00159E2F09|nr:AAA family ATPase [Desulfolutivibrio sulfoxidireducens]QLA16824.1 AAA family ATPase [Desulfolutivibrio sulfoxidireducens]
MIVKLTLVNFMAHGESVFEFATGLNALTGPNNSGKSAVVEALRCLAENPAPKHVIRHGAGEARVEVLLDDGTRVAWVRKSKYAIYELTPPGAAEPVTYAKFGRTPPEDVLAALRLNAVHVESGEDIDVHLGNQREPVFLLGKPGSVMASFFAASTESAHLIAMQNLLTDKVRKAKQEKRRLEAETAAARRDLDRLARLPDLEYALETGRGMERVLTGLAREIPALEQALAAREAVSRRAAALGGRQAVLAGLRPAPVLAPVAELERAGARLVSLRAAQKMAVGKVTALAPLSAPKVLADAASLARTTDTLRRTSAALDRARRKAHGLSSLAMPPATFDVAALADHLARRQTLAVRKAGLEKKFAAGEGLSPPPALSDAGPLFDLVSELSRLRARLAEAVSALGARTARLDRLHADIEKRLDQIGVCPLCGNDLRSETFLAVAGRAS